MAGLLVVRSRKMRVERQKAQVPGGTPTWKQKHWGLKVSLGCGDPGEEDVAGVEDGDPSLVMALMSRRNVRAVGLEI